MIRHLTLCALSAGICVATAAPALAQFDLRRPVSAVLPVSSSPHADVHGTILDDLGRPLAGAVVSAFGSTTVFAVSNPDGRFALRKLPYGPYLVRAHLDGYQLPRARLIQVNRTSLTVSAISLTRHADEVATPVLTAGFAVDPAPRPEPAGTSETESHDHGEVAWRLRHMKRSVLKDAAIGLIDVAGRSDSMFGDSLAGLGWAIGTPARLATSFLADVPWNGHVDLLTSASFHRPEDLLSMQSWPARGTAFVVLEGPTESGHWAMRGAVTHGDVSSWMLATSFRSAPAPHQYEAGLSYGAQSYPVAGTRSTVTKARKVGALYGYDEWTISSRLAVNYGARYARYDYLDNPGLFSPRASVTITPNPDDSLKLRATVSHRVTAPGAEEFIPPSTGTWLPAERTFSAWPARRGFSPQQLDHFELAAERAWAAGDLVVGARAFRQEVDNQLVTLFGILPPGASARGMSHYRVVSGGSFMANGWGMGIRRSVVNRVSAAVDYTHVNAEWTDYGRDAGLLTTLDVARRHPRERFHDVTTSLDSTLPVTDTRLYLTVKLNSRLAHADAEGATRPGARFDFQLTQGLPFLRTSQAHWEMLVAVRNLFRDDVLDASAYDELFVVRPPKRVVGGVIVRF